MNFDGTLIGYTCSDKTIKAYNTQNIHRFSQINPYPQATEVKILSEKSMVITEGGAIHQISINLSLQK